VPRVQTVEGLAQRDRLHPIQEAFLKHGGAQCGICTPGIAVCAKQVVDAGLIAGPDARARVRELLAGNLCRCTGYQLIVDAVVAAAGLGEDGAP
jgi:carbon-monoxide dehydrogenase small subunit